MNEWIANDPMKLCGDVADGLEQTPAAFVDLLEGRTLIGLSVGLESPVVSVESGNWIANHRHVVPAQAGIQ
jgi:hypothetical protein